MHHVRVTDAKNSFARLSTAVERGESFIITRHGTPIASRRRNPISAARSAASAHLKAISLVISCTRSRPSTVSTIFA